MAGTPEAIYADHAATTPLRPEVAEAMERCRRDDFGNPSSGHAWGRRARRRLEEARAAAAAHLGRPGARTCFTAGGTESDNIAVLGRARRALARDGAAVVATSEIEHPAVTAAASQAAREGARHEILPVRGGRFDFGRLDRVLDAAPAVVSCMWVNNETGLVLPVAEIAARCRARGAVLHSDAVQAVGKVPVSLADAPVHLLTAAGHKIGGPMGAGALVASDLDGADPLDGVAPLHFGGGQQRGIRPGTENVAAAVGLAAAIGLAVAEQAAESARLAAMRDEIEARLLALAPGLRVYGGDLPRAPHILALDVPGADSDTLLAALDALGVAASGGSACASGSTTVSPSLVSLLPPRPGRPSATLRLSFGRLSAAAHIDRLVAAVAEAIDRTRALAAAS